MTGCLENKKILLIDDESGVLTALSLLLKALGAEVTGMSDPEAAFAYLSSAESHIHDAILSDLRMPEHDGMDMLSQRNEHCPQTPFILISGHATTKEVGAALSSGANGFLAKPFSPEDVARVFSEIGNQ